MLTLTEVIVGALATWRLSHLFLYENGPFGLLRTLRECLGVTYDELGHVVSYRWEITTCIWCLSVWVGLIVTFVFWLSLASFWFLLPFALSAASCLLGKRVGE